MCEVELYLLLIRDSKRKLTFYPVSSQSHQKNYEVFSRSNTEGLHKGCHDELICRPFTPLSHCAEMRGQFLSSLRGRQGYGRIPCPPPCTPPSTTLYALAPAPRGQVRGLKQKHRSRDLPVLPPWETVQAVWWETFWGGNSGGKHYSASQPSSLA